MVSAAEQLAANLNFGAFAKADDLKSRICVHAGRADRLSLRDVHPAARHQSRRLRADVHASSSGILGMFNMFAGGAVERMAIFALNIMPYISASIIMQLMSSMSPTLEA